MSEREVEVLEPPVKVRVLAQTGDGPEHSVGEGEFYVTRGQRLQEALADFMVYVGGEIRKDNTN